MHIRASIDAGFSVQAEGNQSIQRITRKWLEGVLKAKGWTPNRLAKEAKVSPATIHRALNDEDLVTSNTVLDKIARAAGVPSPIEGKAAPGLREPDAVFMEPAVLPSAFRPGAAQAVWQLKTRATELAGYLPGDYVLVDQGVEPAAGSLVCAQIYDLNRDTADTVFRVFDPPYIVTRTMDPNLSAKPLPVDDDHVKIWGTVIRMLRESVPSE
jgi:transcriptional regulator with XRE-family HTH domain